MASTKTEYGELPLQILSNGGNVAVYDANGAEVVPFTETDWRDEALLNVPNMSSVLKQAYEEPASLLESNSSWMEGQYEGERETWADGDKGPNWFDPEPLPSAPHEISEEDVGGTPPLHVIVDDEAAWPEDPDTIPGHEVRIVDAENNVIYRKHAEEYAQGGEQVAELIKAIRLTYEEPVELLRLYA